MKLAGCAGLLVATCGLASAEVLLLLTDGRDVRADRIGPETDGRRIAVRRESAGISMTRLLSWQEVDSAVVDGRRYDREALRATFAGQSGTEKRSNETAAVSRPAVAAPSDGPASIAVHAARRGGAIRSLGPVRGGPRLMPHDASRPAGIQPMHGPPLLEGLAGPPPCGPGFDGRGVLDARIIGVRDDPLSAYHGLLSLYFPDGVPVCERPFVLDLMRARTARDVLVPPAFLHPPAGPLPPREGPPLKVPPAPDEISGEESGW